MNQYNFLLEILIIMSIICSLTVITSTNPIIAIIYLICVFLFAAIYLILIGLTFIGLSYIIVYIGAITVLFLFVIMMINTDILDIVEIGTEYGKNLPLAYTISILLFIFFIFFIPNFLLNIYNIEIFNFFNNFLIFKVETPSFVEQVNILNNSNYIYNISSLGSTFSAESSISNVLQIEILGELLYSQGAILLLLTSFILLLSLVAPIILSKKTITT
jgi:NADH-ubiquinone oxidoreductase chain 6